MQRARGISGWLMVVSLGLASCESEPLKGHDGETGGGASVAGSSAEGGGAGGQITSAGSGGTGGVASNMGYPFGGSCVMPDSCTDEWDILFGAETLAKICDSQGGTWSRNQCDKSRWAKACVQTMADAYYVQYLPADGACVDGEEAPL